MLQERLMFHDALASSVLTIITRQRLKITRDQGFGQLDYAAVL